MSQNKTHKKINIKRNNLGLKHASTKDCQNIEKTLNSEIRRTYFTENHEQKKSNLTPSLNALIAECWLIKIFKLMVFRVKERWGRT